MSLILGIDPGSRVTGYGLVNATGNRLEYVGSGCIRTTGQVALAERLALIFSGVTQVIEQFQPDQLAVEKIFVARNANSSLKLGQARGAALVAAVQQGLPVEEYEAKKVKQAVVGTGAATKEQVQQMVTRLLSLSACPPPDAADALACAICHANIQQNLVRLSGNLTVTRYRRRRFSAEEQSL